MLLQLLYQYLYLYHHVIPAPPVGLLHPVVSHLHHLVGFERPR